MNRGAPKSVRRRFFVALGHAVHLTWPVLSTILAIQVALGLLVGFMEDAPDLCRHGHKSHVLLTPDQFAGGLQVAFVTVQLPA